MTWPVFHLNQKHWFQLIPRSIKDVYPLHIACLSDSPCCCCYASLCCSGSFIDAILGRSPRKLIIITIKKMFPGSKYPKNSLIWFWKQKRCSVLTHTKPSTRLRNASCEAHQWFFFSRHIGKVAPKISYFQYLILFFFGSTYPKSS